MKLLNFLLHPMVLMFSLVGNSYANYHCAVETYVMSDKGECMWSKPVGQYQSKLTTGWSQIQCGISSGVTSLTTGTEGDAEQVQFISVSPFPSINPSDGSILGIDRNSGRCFKYQCVKQ